jgi:hypothetical protein
VRIAIDILHPAHVHFFRNFRQEMLARGHEILVTAREKDCTLPLLKGYGIPHTVISRQARKGPGLAWELASRTMRFWRLARAFGAEALTGIMGPTIAPAAKLLKARSVVFYDTEMAAITNRFVYPLADAVCTPECYRGSAGPRQIRYRGYHELAYLHPNRFTPDPGALRKHGIDPETPFFVVRFVSWQASHDIGEKGLTLEGKRRIVEILAKEGRVLITSESPLPAEFEAYRLPIPVQDAHHVLAFARLLVGESATMASEAAVLGTHAAFISRTGRGYTDEQESRYGLVRNFSDADEEDAIACVAGLCARPDLRREAKQAHARLLKEHIDVTDWMVRFFENDLQEPN